MSFKCRYFIFSEIFVDSLYGIPYYYIEVMAIVSKNLLKSPRK